MNQPGERRTQWVPLLLWVCAFVAASSYVLFFTRERGSGMSGLLCVLVGALGGGVALLVAIVHASPLSKRSRRRWVADEVFILTIAATFFGLIGVVRYGGYLYRRDQEDAQQFVEHRIARVKEIAGTGGAFPSTQDEFVAGEALPRILRGSKFYFHDGGREFHVEIHVDFDGGWNYSSKRPYWYRST